MSMFNADTLNHAFRQLMGGADLITLQHNRYWKKPDGLVLGVGAYAAALEYASGVEPVVVGKPSRDFFEMTLADAGAAAGVTCHGHTVEALHPWEAILDHAKAQACDLIVMASHGRRGVTALLLGSETQKVLTHSTLPVLVVR